MSEPGWLIFTLAMLIAASIAGWLASRHFTRLRLEAEHYAAEAERRARFWNTRRQRTRRRITN